MFLLFILLSSFAFTKLFTYSTLLLFHPHSFLLLLFPNNLHIPVLLEYLTKPPNFSSYGLNSHAQDSDDISDVFTDRKFHQSTGIPPPAPPATVNQKDIQIQTQSQSNNLNHTLRGPNSSSSSSSSSSSGYSKGLNTATDPSITLPSSSNFSNESGRNDWNKKKASILARDTDDANSYPGNNSNNRSSDSNDVKGMDRNSQSGVGHTSTLSGTKAVSIRPSFSRTIGSADAERSGGEKMFA